MLGVLIYSVKSWELGRFYLSLFQSPEGFNNVSYYVSTEKQVLPLERKDPQVFFFFLFLIYIYISHQKGGRSGFWWTLARLPEKILLLFLCLVFGSPQGNIGRF